MKGSFHRHSVKYLRPQSFLIILVAGWSSSIFAVESVLEDAIQQSERIAHGTVECELLVVGGGFGGCAAAFRACSFGHEVWMTESCDWIGGQITSQGVSALDEHQYIETFGGTDTYNALRTSIRNLARNRYTFKEEVRDNPLLNPGKGWVSRLCFEPRLGLEALEILLTNPLKTGNLHILTRAEPVKARVENNRVVEVVIQKRDGNRVIFQPQLVIDATDLGELLPLADVEHVVGAEARSETGEPGAPPGEGNPECQQSFTYTYAIEYCPGENHTIPKPPDYEFNRNRQPYSLDVGYGGDIGKVTYKIFEVARERFQPFWTYRRLLDASQLNDPRYPHDIAMINWSANDYKNKVLVGGNREEAMQEAKQLSLGFLYWLQTEVPRDDGSGKGYPEFKLRYDVMGTEDGLSQFPYIRESRRIKALTRIVEQDLAATFNPGPRARLFEDSVGIGLYYMMDIHGCGAGETGKPQPVKPFQIPMGALIPIRVKNVLAGCKNIGTTHLTNGAYRLHPVEWNIGESAGMLAHFALRDGVDPAALRQDPARKRQVQDALIECGVPLFWYIDVPFTDGLFPPLQRLAGRGIISDGSDPLEFRGEEPLDRQTALTWIARTFGDASPAKDADGAQPLTKAETVALLEKACERHGLRNVMGKIRNDAEKNPEEHAPRGIMVRWLDRIVQAKGL